MSTPMRFTLKLIPFLLGCMLVAMLYIADSHLFPVIDNFTFSQLAYDRTTNQIKGSGYLTKIRNCDYLAVIATGRDFDKLNPIELIISADTAYTAMELGAHSFGTFTVKIPDNKQFNQIEFSILHRCHPFWVTSTHLKEIPAPRTLYMYESY